MTDAPPYRLHEPLPTLDRPVLVVCLTGWIDASGAAAAAMDAVREQIGARPIVGFDDDAFIDYRARRPTMELREGLSTRLVWNTPELSVGADPQGRDVLLLTGPEPDMAWRRFADTVADLAVALGVHEMVGLGAYPFATPHTRPTRLSCTTPSTGVLERVAFLRSSVDVPAGTEALLEHALHDRGIDTIGLWVQVPHYVAAMAYPAASAALVDALDEHAGLALDAGPLRAEAVIQRQRLDALIAGNDEHQAMVRQLEDAFDEVDEQLDPTPLPSGGDLAREVEEFLRDLGADG